MKYAILLLAALLYPTTGFAQPSVEPRVASARTEVQHPQDAAPDPGELIAYRFRLGVADADFSLVAVNKTDQPGHFFFRGLTPELESLPHTTQPTRIDPGQTVTITRGELGWLDFQCVYVEASRRIELRLARDDESGNLAIRLKGHETLYDVMSEERLGESDSRDFDLALSLIGEGTEPLHLKAHEDLLGAGGRLERKTRADRSKIFLVIPLKRNPPSPKN